MFLRNKVVPAILSALGEDVLAVIVFGSYARFGHGRDIDLLVITRTKIGRKLDVEELSKMLTRMHNYKRIFDVRVTDLNSFRKCLGPPSFISGVLLGYEVLYDKIGVKRIIENVKASLRSKGLTYTYVDEYGVWHIP